MKKYGITLFLTLILLLGLVVPAVSAQMPDAAPAETQEQSAAEAPEAQEPAGEEAAAQEEA